MDRPAIEQLLAHPFLQTALAPVSTMTESGASEPQATTQDTASESKSESLSSSQAQHHEKPETVSSPSRQLPVQQTLKSDRQHQGDVASSSTRERNDSDERNDVCPSPPREARAVRRTKDTRKTSTQRRRPSVHAAPSDDRSSLKASRIPRYVTCLLIKLEERALCRLTRFVRPCLQPQAAGVHEEPAVAYILQHQEQQQQQQQSARE